MTCTVHLIRHGSHDLLGRVLLGRGDVALSPQGQAEAEAVAAALADAGLTALISSPRTRARQTAAPIAARAGLPIVIDPDIDEIDLGEWSGASFETLRQDAHWRSFNAQRAWALVPGGETMLAVQGRAVAAMQRLHQQHPNGTLAVVSHSDVIKAIVMHVLGVPLDLIHRFEIAPASCSTILLDDSGCMVERINMPAGRQRGDKR